MGNRAATGEPIPDREAALDPQQEEIREASMRLPKRQRKARGLREREQLSYEEIAAIMETNAHTVAQLISRARINLRDELHGTALASVAAPSPECERALPLIAMREDGQLEAASPDTAWLDSHLAGCDPRRPDRRRRGGIERPAGASRNPETFQGRQDEGARREGEGEGTEARRRNDPGVGPRPSADSDSGWRPERSRFQPEPLAGEDGGPADAADVRSQVQSQDVADADAYPDRPACVHIDGRRTRSRRRIARRSAPATRTARQAIRSPAAIAAALRARGPADQESQKLVWRFRWGVRRFAGKPSGEAT